MSHLHPTPTVSAFSRKLSNELEDILSDLETKETAAANAQSAYEEAKEASAKFINDDGSLSASELFERRKQAERTLEICEIDTKRVVRDRDNAQDLYFNTLHQRVSEVRNELFRLAKEREESATAQIVAVLNPESRNGHFVTSAISELMKYCDGVTDRKIKSQSLSGILSSINIGGKRPNVRLLVDHLKSSLPLLEENPTPCVQQ